MLHHVKHVSFLKYTSIRNNDYPPNIPQYPEVLTAGVFKRAGAKREDLKKMTFTVTQIGHGWSEKLAEGSDEHTNPPDSSIIVKVIYIEL